MTTSRLSTFENNLYYPPGGILIWIIILLEVITFSIGLIAFNVFRGDEPDVFISGQSMLNTNIGLVNTMILLTSGFFMAMAVHALKKGNHKKSGKNILVTLVFGVAFLVLKGYEYSEKISHGIELDDNTFFMFYWLLTGFHFVHVFLGVLILVYIFFKTTSGHYNGSNTLDVESSAAFWHMCDLIWLFLFPVIYLLH